MHLNSLFLFCNHTFPGVTIGIGSRSHKRVVRLSEDEALQLAYRLMSLAKGGATQGFEEFRAK